MIGFLVAAAPLLVFLLSIFQISLLWMGKGVLDTAAHLAARKFARTARLNFQNARQEAFLEAFRTLRNRPGGLLASVELTTLDITLDGKKGTDRAAAGEALCIRLTHGVELIVPWVDRLLYILFPCKKLQLGGRYYLLLETARWVTVE